MQRRDWRTSLPHRSPFHRAAALAVTLAVGLTLAACGSSNSGGNGSGKTSGKVTLTFWNWVPVMPHLVQMFNKTHPNIKVVDIAKPGGSNGQYPDLFTAIKSGTTPDLAQVEYDVLPQFIATGGLLDLTKYGAASQKSLYSPFAWNQVTVGGGIYALPMGDAPDGLYYSASGFKRYGLAVPSTWSQLASEATALHKAHPSEYLTYLPTSAKWFALFGWQQDAPWFSVSHGAWKVNIDSPAMLRAAQLWQPLLDSGAVTLQPAPDRAAPPWFKNISDGSILSMVCAQWCGAVLQDYASSQSGKWRAAPLPQWAPGQHASAQFGGSTTAIFKTTKHPQQALTFASWLVSNEQSVNAGATTGIGWPVQPRYDTVSSLTGPNPYFGGQKSAQLWARAEANTPKSWNYGPDFLTLTTQMGDLYPAVAAKKMTLAQMFQRVQAEQVSTLRAKGISVAG